MDFDTAIRFVRDNREEIMAIATVLLVVATFALVMGADKNAKRELRAYMGFENGSIRHVAVGEKPTLDILFTNFGKTPAYDVRYWINAGVMDRSTSAFKRRTFGPGRVIDPENTLRILSTFDDPLTQEQLDGVKRGDTPIFYWGRVRYRDAFPLRKAEFRVQHGGDKVMCSDRMIFSSRGNTAT
jgi:hypothetical protein